MKLAIPAKELIQARLDLASLKRKSFPSYFQFTIKFDSLISAVGANDSQWIFNTLLAAQREEVAFHYYVAHLNRGLEVSSPHEFKDLAEAHKHFENLMPCWL